MNGDWRDEIPVKLGMVVVGDDPITAIEALAKANALETPGYGGWRRRSMGVPKGKPGEWKWFPLPEPVTWAIWVQWRAKQVRIGPGTGDRTRGTTADPATPDVIGEVTRGEWVEVPAHLAPARPER